MGKIDKIICFDLETTGVIATQDDVIEIALSVHERGDDGKISVNSKRIDEFVKTDVRIEEKLIDRLDEHGNQMTIASLTHISQDMLDEFGIEEKEMVDLFIKTIYDDPCSNVLVIGYNVNFDLNFMYEKIMKYYPNFEFERNNINYLDVMTFYKDYHTWDKELGHRLDAAVKNLNVSVPNTHRAIDDVDATYEAFQKLVKKYNTLTPYINHFGYNIKYGYESNLTKVTYIPQGGGSRAVVNHGRV